MHWLTFGIFFFLKMRIFQGPMHVYCWLRDLGNQTFHVLMLDCWCCNLSVHDFVLGENKRSFACIIKSLWIRDQWFASIYLSNGMSSLIPLIMFILAFFPPIVPTKWEKTSYLCRWQSSIIVLLKTFFEENYWIVKVYDL